MAKLIGSKKKITKEPDEFQSFTQKVRLQISDHPRQAAIVAGAGLGMVLIFVFALFLVEKAGEKRLVTFNRMVERYLGDDDPARDSAAIREELGRHSKKLSGTELGGQALYYLGGIASKEGDYDAAVEAYRKVREDYATIENLADAASLGMAYTYLLMGENESALSTFRELLKKESAPIPRSQVQLEIGSILEDMGKEDEAISTYRGLVEAAPDSPWGTQARKRLDRLEGV